MSNNEKKKALLAYKEKILQEIQYYDKTIEDFRAKSRNNSYYDDDSSDTEEFFEPVDLTPHISELKQLQSTLKTCLQATQELTSLTVLQSEVNLLVQPPDLNGEKPVTEAGSWKEVTAECRIDTVPFTITFFMHTPNRKFGPILTRKLQVTLIKSPHEVELANSVLHTLKTPSDAVGVIKSYAAAFRSRRTTLARLVNKYSNSLFMEPHPEGGFLLKCANRLEILWRLENKWSPVAPFHHRMKFDLEYMDESYIKIIMQAHKQLSDQTLETDERTLLLSKIISTVLLANGPGDSESDLESRQTETQAEIKTRDNEVMAPPKSLPKKGKKVSKNDVGRGVPLKRSVEGDEGGSAKKVKNNEGVSNNVENVSEVTKTQDKSDAKIVTSNKKAKTSFASGVTKKKSDENLENVKKVNKKAKQNTNVNAVTQESNTINKNNDAKVAKKRKNDEAQQKSAKNAEKGSKKVKNFEKDKNKNTDKSEEVVSEIVNSNNVGKNDIQTDNNEKSDKTIKKAKVVSEKSPKNDKIEELNKEMNENNQNIINNEVPKKTDKKTKMSIANDKKFDLITKKMSINIDNKGSNTRSKTVGKNSAKNVASAKNSVSDKEINVSNEPKSNSDKDDGQKSKYTDKNIAKSKNKAVKDTDIYVVASTKNKVVNDTDKTVVSSKNKAVTDTDKNVASSKNKEVKQAKNAPKIVASEKFSEKQTTNENKTKAIETVKIINVNIMKKATVKNANTIKNKDKIINKMPEKASLNKPETKPNHKQDKNAPKLSIQKYITLKSPHKNAVKSQIIPKATNIKVPTGNTRLFTGNTDRENGGKSKIPQKMSISSESNFKMNTIRMSPRHLPSKLKSSTQDSGKTMMKTTNIPRLLKKPVPKTSK